jgi:putative ABC transport system ATP-binding protein
VYEIEQLELLKTNNISMLKAIDISKNYSAYGVETQALINVNFQVAKGEYVAVLGPAGSGKSTLLKLAGLMLVPTLGSLTFNDKEVVNLSEPQRLALRRGNIGFLQADAMLIDSLTVAENIELPLKYLSYSRQERLRMVKEKLMEIKLVHRTDAYPYQLTGLQKQLVSLARALVVRPLLIVADEPTGQLNSGDTEELLYQMDNAYSQGISLLHATQSPTLAARAARTIKLFDGHVVSELHIDKMQ